MSGIETAITMSVAGTGASISKDGTNYSSSVSVVNGNTLYLKIIANSSYGGTRTGTVSGGGKTAGVTVTTRAADTTLSSLSFGSNVGAASRGQTIIRSDIMAGIETAITMAVSGDGTISKNGINYYSSLSVVNGDNLRLKIVASSSYGGFKSATVSGGGRTDTLSVTTESAPVATYTPFPFTHPTTYSLSDLVAFFGGGNGLADFYRGGAYVPDVAQNSGIPTAAQGGLSLDDFYGSVKLA
jgi:hypothetical protein